MFMLTMWIFVFFKPHNCAEVCETSEILSESSYVQSEGETSLKPAEKNAYSMSEGNPPLCFKQLTQTSYHSLQNKKKISFNEKKYILQHILVSIKEFKELYEYKKLIIHKVLEIRDGLETNHKEFPQLEESEESEMSDEEDSAGEEDSANDEDSASDEELTSSEKKFIYKGKIGDEKINLDDFMVVQVDEMASEAIDANKDSISSTESFQCKDMYTDDNMTAEDQQTQCVEMSTEEKSIDSEDYTESIRAKTNANINAGDDRIAKNTRNIIEKLSSDENSFDSSEEKTKYEDRLHAKLLKEFFVDSWEFFAYAKDLNKNNGFIEENGTIEYMKSSLFQRRVLQEEINNMRSEFIKKQASLIKTKFYGHQIDLIEKDHKYQQIGFLEDWSYNRHLVCMKKLARYKMLLHRKALSNKIVPLSSDKNIYYGEMAEKINVKYLELNGWKDDFYQLFKDEYQKEIAKKIAETANKLTYTKIQLSFLSSIVPEETDADIRKKSSLKFTPFFKQIRQKRHAVKSDEKNRRKNITKGIMNLLEYEDEFLEFEKLDEFEKFKKFSRMLHETKRLSEWKCTKIMRFIRKAILKPLEDQNKCRKTVDMFLKYEANNTSNIFWSFLDDDETHEIKLNSIVFPKIGKENDQKTHDEDKLNEIMIEQLFRDNLIIIKDSKMFLCDSSQHNKAKFEILMKCYAIENTTPINNLYYYDHINAISDVIYKILSEFIFNLSGEIISSKTIEEQPKENPNESDIHCEPDCKKKNPNDELQQNIPALEEWIEEFESCWNFTYENTLLSRYKTKNSKNLFENAEVRKHEESEKNQGDLKMSEKIKTIPKEDRLDVLFTWYVFYMTAYTNYFIDHYFIINKEIPNEIFYEVLITYDRWESFLKAFNKSNIDLKLRSKEEEQYESIENAIRCNIKKYKIELTKILDDLFIQKTISLRD